MEEECFKYRKLCQVSDKCCAGFIYNRNVHAKGYVNFDLYLANSSRGITPRSVDKVTKGSIPGP
jgi:hypothetical protein